MFDDYSNYYIRDAADIVFLKKGSNFRLSLPAPCGRGSETLQEGASAPSCILLYVGFPHTCGSGVHRRASRAKCYF